MKPMHPLAGRLTRLASRSEELDGQPFRVEDWAENVLGQSWMTANGNPAALTYAMRSGALGLPTDDQVLYGKVGHLGYLVHVSEVKP